MQTFEWIDATSVEHAAALMATSRADDPVVAKAGGMDLLDLMKARLAGQPVDHEPEDSAPAVVGPRSQPASRGRGRGRPSGKRR